MVSERCSRERRLERRRVEIIRKRVFDTFGSSRDIPPTKNKKIGTPYDSTDWTISPRFERGRNNRGLVTNKKKSSTGMKNCR